MDIGDKREIDMRHRIRLDLARHVTLLPDLENRVDDVITFRGFEMLITQLRLVNQMKASIDAPLHGGLRKRCGQDERHDIGKTHGVPQKRPGHSAVATKGRISDNHDAPFMGRRLKRQEIAGGDALSLRGDVERH